jgi:hypothetical protein
VPAEDIPHIESLLTVVGGRIVYAAAVSIHLGVTRIATIASVWLVDV